ncbi:hypothetical protein ABW20_dc0106907 [Dactylellina cionopaga]|nr:hypothetical protein ABW20_dc0106907 [Dactylellina cionopaga]
MASIGSIPSMLRSTARATAISTSSSSASTSTICSSSCHSSLVSRLKPFFPSISTRRSYADDSAPSKPNPTDNLLTLLTNSHEKPIIPTPALADAASFLPQKRTSIGQIWNQQSRSAARPSQRLGRSGLFGISKDSFEGGAEYPAGATILDPWAQLFHLHIYSTKHNTHITFTDPKKNAIISCSTGILGFRKAGRHTYDAAYQLAAHVFQKIEEKGLIPKKVEVILRGFGVGREACVKALLGKEGRYIKDVVVRVTDATRTKFGGTRTIFTYTERVRMYKY